MDCRSALRSIPRAERAAVISAGAEWRAEKSRHLARQQVDREMDALWRRPFDWPGVAGTVVAYTRYELIVAA